MKRSLPTLTLALIASSALATPKDALVYQVSSATASVEPAQALVTYDALPTMQMYEGLYLNNFGRYEPLLATGFTQSKDGKTTTFTLRKGVKFHDGSTMTCADVEYSMRRTFLVGSETSRAAQVRANLLSIPGFTPEVKKTFTFAKLSSLVKCNAAGQLVLTLDRNVPSLLDSITTTYIVPMKALVAGGDWSGTARDFAAFMGKDVSNSTLAQKPIGTGAYQFVARDPSRFVMRGFDGYWGGAPKLKNVIIQKVDSDTARVLALQKGDADIAIVPDRDTLAKLKGVPGVKVYEDLPTQNLTGVILFNQNIKDDKLLPAGQLAENNIPVNFFSDIHVRRAFAALFDTKTYVRDGQKGFAQARNTTLPPNNWAEDKTLRPPAYNLKTAEAELKQAFGGKLWTTGFTVPLETYAGLGISDVIAGIFKQNIEKLNPKFHATISTLELSAANARLLGGKSAFGALTWGGADPDTVLRGLYSSGGILAPATNFKDPKLEEMLDKARDTVGQNARRPLYRTVLRYLNQQTYAFPLPQPLAFAATTSALKGYPEFNNTNLFRVLSK
ncbi:ABC transporter substrate-binding protein [Deinococcus apachensis]|uniref:ABC transporter substrate-binding protein n=1 Tax=Deinococcus apachensis TaxID=309886 RepID=UPI000370EEAD|nr:ABC transporter substrate-binding protein [Deinococcus apachensis]